MPDPASSHPSFSFVSKGLPNDTFTVVRFRGEEHISGCYRFEIMLSSKKSDIDFSKVLKDPATLSIRSSGGSALPVNGIVTSFELTKRLGDTMIYNAVLMPRLFRLTLIHQNRIFLDKSMQEILTKQLEDGGLDRHDFQFNLHSPGQKLEYVCQFRETNLEFMNHRMEDLGWYFFFRQENSGEKLVITDMKDAHTPFRNKSTLTFVEPSGLESQHLDECVHAFVCRQQLIPGKITTRNYNYRKPSLDVRGTCTLSSANTQEVYLYGGNYDMPEDAKSAARTLADEYLCRERIYHAESSVTGVIPGSLFTLSGHFRNDFNREYLVVSISHEGNQECFKPQENGHATGNEKQDHPWYRNSFTAIESNRQFRPERLTEPSRFYGTLNARVDASGNGDYAEIDDAGRYKVILPFDMESREPGKASCWIRMMQPYGGKNEGMYFPLRKDTEVLLTFIDGNPDRPVIAGVLPNIVTPSSVIDKNASMGKIASPSGQVIHFEDKRQKESLLVYSKPGASWVRFGEGLDNKTGINDDDPKPGIKINTEKHLYINAKEESKTTYSKDYTLNVVGDMTTNIQGDLKEIFNSDKTQTIKGDYKGLYEGDKTLICLGKYSASWNDKVNYTYKSSADYAFEDKVVEAFKKEKSEIYSAKRNTILKAGATQMINGKIETKGEEKKEVFANEEYIRNNIKNTSSKVTNVAGMVENTIQKETNNCQMSTNNFMTLQNAGQTISITAAQINIM
jgi:type VI secretion system secreted protein VgrG